MNDRNAHRTALAATSSALRAVLSLAAILFAAAPLAAATPPCSPCAGIVVDNPAAVIPLLQAAPQLGEEERLYVAWDVELSPTAETTSGTAFDPATAAAISEAGGTPWLRLVFRTGAPLLSHLDALEAELSSVAEIARLRGIGDHFQILWQPPTEVPTGTWEKEYGFLLKRVAVTLTGSNGEARVITAPLAADSDRLAALYAEEIAAYVDGIALAPGPEEKMAAAVAQLTELDPGRPVALDALPFPDDPWQTLSAAAEKTAAGVAITFFTASAIDAAAVAPLKLLAREFHGDITLDPYSVPSGGLEAWSFVRGEDLSLRVIVRAPPGSDTLVVRFPDALLRGPARLDPATGEPIQLYDQSRTADGFEVRIRNPDPVTVLRVERMTAGDLELEGVGGIEEEVTISDQRQMPVEEILRRLQAFEDRQDRNLNHYQAINATHLRFSIGTTDQAVEVTFEGDFFFQRDRGFDWAWQRFFFNGVKWRHKTIPEIPLIQPEKAAAMPVEISFTKEYSYRLRGTATIDGRDCWVVDFEPAVAVTPERTLFQGTLWVDREVYARVRTRAVQLGLKGDVLSNEETQHFSPVDAAGQEAAWAADSYILPLRVVGQQIWSILSATTVVERETTLSEIRINAGDFTERREEVLASDTTMVRDTEAGVRYLLLDEETGERVVEEKVNMSRKFLAGGILHDETFKFPLPLAGINWLSLDWREKGSQANVFFAGILGNAAFTNPAIGDSQWDFGFDATAFLISFRDVSFRDGEEIEAEAVKTLRPNIDFKLGHPLGNFVKLDLRYRLGYNAFGDADDTADDFVVPSNHLSHTFSAITRYNRGGYRFVLQGSHTIRGSWEQWGTPGSDEFDSDDDRFSKWGASFGKVWHLPNFRKIGLELEYIDGTNLDRFSKYGFGLFSDIRVHGYQIDKVRADEALAAHLRYGFDLGSVLRLDLVGDTAWATDIDAGMDKELLAGVGLAGTFPGPGRTLINLDLGVAVAGPDEGISVLLVVLKLFDHRRRHRSK